MGLSNANITFLSDIFDQELNDLHQKEVLINDLVKTIYRRPIVFDRFRKDINKFNLQDFNNSNNSIWDKTLKNINIGEVNFKQLKYLDSRIDTSLDSVKAKVLKSKHSKTSEKLKNVLITDEIFQKEINKILDHAEDDKFEHKNMSYKSILSGLEDAETEIVFLEKDDNNFGEEIDLFDFYNKFCELTGNFKLTLTVFLEQFLLNKFKYFDYSIRNNDFLEKLNRSTVKIWNSKAYLNFLRCLADEIKKNIMEYQSLIPIEYILQHKIIPHYNKVIRSDGIFTDNVDSVICQYCKLQFENRDLFSKHKHTKVSRVKEGICLKEYELHFLVTVIETRLHTTILNSKIFSKLSFTEKNKLQRFSKFEMYPLLEREHDRKQEKIEKASLEDLAYIKENIKLLPENEDILHEDRFIREQENEIDEENKDSIPTWLIKLQKLDEKYQCEVCGDINYKGKSIFELHFNEKRHIFGLKQLGYSGSDYEIFNGITKIVEVQSLLEEIKNF
ncbi:hypothetical protein QEN19_003604 [Hanseniaspora menglaensis]